MEQKVDTNSKTVFRILHGCTGLPEIVNKWKSDNNEGKITFIYLNAKSKNMTDITKIAGFVENMWADSEGLVVVLQFADTEAGHKLIENFNGSRTFTLSPIAKVNGSTSQDKDQVVSFSGINFTTK